MALTGSSAANQQGIALGGEVPPFRGVLSPNIDNPAFVGFLRLARQIS
jgi:hypothetical protein